MLKRRRPPHSENDFQAVDNVREPPRPDWPAAPFTGAKWGARIGLIASIVYLGANQISAFGISAYPGDAGLVIIPIVLGGALVGALFGFVTLYLPEDKK